MKKFSFAKMSGAGNDFILFDKKFDPSLLLLPEDIRAVCARRTGIGADGVLVIDDHQGYNFSMEYFNADGSTGSLCGNGARCAIRYAHLMGRDDQNFVKFISNGLEYKGEILDPVNIKFYLNEPYDLNLKMNLKGPGQTIPASFINTGSPHAVILINDIRKDAENSFYTDIQEVPVFELGRMIRYLDDFKPGGTNVNFIQLMGSKVLIRTYERGVEDETLACGTGSTAAALIANLRYDLKPPVKLVTQSGDELIVDFQQVDKRFRNVSLSGPAEVTFTGEFYSNKYFNKLEK